MLGSISAVWDPSRLASGSHIKKNVYYFCELPSAQPCKLCTWKTCDFLEHATPPGFTIILISKYNPVCTRKVVSSLSTGIRTTVITPPPPPPLAPSPPPLFFVKAAPPSSNYAWTEWLPAGLLSSTCRKHWQSQGQSLSAALATTAFSFLPTIRSQPVSPLLRDPGEDRKAAKTRVLPKQLRRWEISSEVLLTLPMTSL